MLDSNGDPDLFGEKEIFGPLSIDRERNRIKDLYIFSGGGKNRSLILRRNVAAFEKEIGILRQKIDLYKLAIQELIKTRTHQIADELLSGLGESLEANPPPHWSSRSLNEKITEEDVERLFREDIQAELNRVRTDFDPKIRIDYKEITYSTFVDKDFRARIEKRFGKHEIDRILKEHDAAPEYPAANPKH